VSDRESSLRIFVAIVGSLLFGLTVANILKTLVIPGGYITKTARTIDHGVSFIYHMASGFRPNYEDKNALLTSQPAAVLFVQLSTWGIIFLLSTSMLLFPVVPNFGAAIREAGASLMTLGFVATNRPWATFVDFTAAFTGMILVALQIAYLPTLYAAYNKRETEVTLLVARAGRPAWGPEVLRRSRLGIVADELPIIYLAWERWSAQVAESHVSYPILLRFRSPGFATSWITSLMAVLDAAAIHLSLAPSDAPMQARLCLQMGFSALRQIARSLRISYDPDPLPTNPISISLSEFAETVEMLRIVGFPIERSVEDAYRHFQGWRVNYEAIVFRLCYEIDALPAPWSGPRRWKNLDVDFPKFKNRTPENPSGS
ncbi:unnamed protein product, partial [Acidithrix sp. C25]